MSRVTRSSPSPTNNTRSGVDWYEVADEVRAAKGEWCQVEGEFNPSVAGHMRNGRYPAINPDEFEITTRQVETGKRRSLIYLRLKG